MRNNVHYSSKFEKAFLKIYKNEGGYVNNKNDIGGETKFGISKKSYPNLDIKNLTIKQAKYLYYNDFWISSNYEKIDNEEIYIKAFDLTVNVGQKISNKIIQRAVRAATKNDVKLAEDGIIGEKTIFEINNINVDVLISAIRSESAGHYRMLVSKNETQNVFLNGWLNRAYS